MASKRISQASVENSPLILAKAQHGAAIKGHHAAAVAALDRILQSESSQTPQEIEDVGRLIVQLRNQLIEQVRQVKEAGEAPYWYAVLDRINEVLELVVSCDNQVTLQATCLKKAREGLSRLFKSTDASAAHRP